MPPKKRRKKAKSSKAASPKGKRIVNKSKAVRDYMDSNPQSMPKEISDALASKGIVVTPGYVSMIKSKHKNKSAGKSRPGRPKKQASGDITVADLVEAKKLVEQLGGVDRAKDAIAAYAKIATG
jgi:hypothetical protein